MRAGVTWLAAIAGLVTLGGCGPKGHAGSEAGPPAHAPRALRVAEVTDAGGIDDQSFNAAAWAGLQRAKKDLGVDARYLSSKEQSDYKEYLSTLAHDGNELVFAVGYLMEDALKEVAPTYPNTRFAIIDGSAPDLPNCVSLKFREEEGSFLAGFLAGKMTKTGALGFVGGVEGPLIRKFEVGFFCGAQTARSDIRVIPKYVGNWTDEPKGKELAVAEFSQGADIIFAAAGKGGLGVIDAANDRGAGFYAIGVDRDQDGIRPGRVLTSMMKGVDTAVYDTVKDLREGRWAPGEHVFGVKEGGVHLSPMTYTKKDVPPAVLAQLDQIQKMIAAGQIKVPATEDERQSFQPPKIP